jgi:hypothetical protein
MKFKSAEYFLGHVAMQAVYEYQIQVGRRAAYVRA